MSRPLRIEYPDCWYHVMNRGRRGEDIFYSSSDYNTFLLLLKETCEEFSLQVSAYCLMPNHYHLLVNTPRGNLSRCMRHINGVYTQRFNKEHEYDGQLFRGRYKSIIIGNDEYLLEVMKYIHMNPVKAGLVHDLLDFPWCSHKGYLSQAKKWEWLSREPLYEMLTRYKTRRKREYLKFMELIESEGITRFYGLKNLPPVLGTESFCKEIKERFRDLVSNKEIRDVKYLAKDPEHIIEIVCRHFKVDRMSLNSKGRSSDNTARDVALYFIRMHRSETLSEVGRYFGLKNYSTVSGILLRFKKRLKVDHDLQKHLSRIMIKLS